MYCSFKKHSYLLGLLMGTMSALQKQPAATKRSLSLVYLYIPSFYRSKFYKYKGGCVLQSAICTLKYNCYMEQ